MESFRSTVVHISDMDVSEQLARFREGLRPELLREILRARATYLQDAIQVATEMEDIRNMSSISTIPMRDVSRFEGGATS